MPNIDLTDYKPLPSQNYLHMSKKQFKAYFGGFGSGKSRWLCYEVLMQCLQHPKNYYVVLRRTYTELKDTILKDFLDYCPANVIKNYNKSDLSFDLVTGSRIIFRSFDGIGKILSLNIGGFAVDQAEEIPEDYFLALASRCRKKGVPHHGLLSMNPAGHNWTWRRFIRDNEGNQELYDYVAVKSEENIHLPKNYIANLRKLFPPQWQKRYLDCGFDDFEGMIWSNFGEKNIVTDLPLAPNKSEFNLIVIDVGIDAPTAVLFLYLILEPLPRIVVYDEIYERNLTIKPIASLIKAKMYKWRLEKVWKYVIDPDALKRQQTSGKSIVDAFRMNGIPCNPGNNNVDLGLLKTNELFGQGKDIDPAVYEEPLILVSNKLEHFFDEVYDYVYKKSRGDLMTEMNSPGKPERKKNHLMDDLRYGVMELPDTYLQSKARRIESMDIYDKYIGKRFGTRRKGKPTRR